MADAGESDLVEVFVGPGVRAGRIHSLLQAEGLHAFLRDERMGPLFVAGGTAGAVKVVVPRFQSEQARQLIADVGE